jgi:hypothetical protein
MGESAPTPGVTARVTLRLLGGFEARIGTGPALVLPIRKAQALLAYLALPAGGVRVEGDAVALDRSVWLTARPNASRVSPDTQPTRCTCSVTSRPTPTGSTPSAARLA